MDITVHIERLILDGVLGRLSVVVARAVHTAVRP